MIPYDMETVRGMRARDTDVRRFAALEFRGADREWARRVSAMARRQKRPAGRWAAFVAYFLAR
jgi:hypothetical protein